MERTVSWKVVVCRPTCNGHLRKTRLPLVVEEYDDLLPVEHITGMVAGIDSARKRPDVPHHFKERANIAYYLVMVTSPKFKMRYNPADNVAFVAGICAKNT